MRKILLFPVIVLFFWSCSPSKQVSKSAGNKISIADSTEYEITIIDVGFDQWYLMNYSPSKDHSNQYYRSKNQLGAGNWNDYFRRGKYHRVIENNINYDYSVDYGIEVNRQLFWYFKFVEEKYRIRLLY